MDFLIKFDEEGVDTFFDDRDELFFCLYVSLIWHELLMHGCQQLFVLCKRQVLDASMDHQMEQIQYQTLVVSEVEEGFDTFPLEGFIVRVLVSSHGINHLLANTDGWLQHSLCRGVFAEDEPEIDVEQMAQLVYHQILQVTISHRHQVSNCTIPRTTLDVDVQDLLILILI